MVQMNQIDGSNTSSRGSDRSVKALKRNKRQFKALEVQITAVKLLLKDYSADEDN